MRVAGVCIRPTIFARSWSSEGRSASALTAVASSDGLAERTAEDDELLVPLGELGRDLGCRDGIGGVSRSSSDP